MNAYLCSLGTVDERNAVTVTLGAATYTVCIDVAESASGATRPEVYAVKLGRAWHGTEAFADDFIQALNAQLRAELLQDAIDSMEPAL